jgi:hypothetical protein
VDVFGEDTDALANAAGLIGDLERGVARSPAACAVLPARGVEVPILEEENGCCHGCHNSCGASAEFCGIVTCQCNKCDRSESQIRKSSAEKDSSPKAA